MKYYIMKRNSGNLLAEYLMDIDKDKRGVIAKQINPAHQFLLIEKTVVIDEVGTSEHYTNLWTMNEGVPQWEKIVKGRTMWDYTGIVHPLIHKDGKVMTFEQYSDINTPSK